MQLDALNANSKVVRADVDDRGVATVSLQRPDRGNSWTIRMSYEYRRFMEALDGSPDVRVIVVTGDGRHFCVGADTQALSGYVGESGYDPTLPEETPTPGFGVHDEFDDDFAWHFGLSRPVVAAINGACAGVAVALVAYCDIRLAVPEAKFTTASARLGLPAEYGLSWVLPRVMRAGGAMEFLFTGQVMRADELHALGFVDRLFPAETFRADVTSYAWQLAAASPLAVRTIKRQVYDDLLHDDPARSIRESRRLTGVLMKEDDYAEGVAALLEKRDPRF